MWNRMVPVTLLSVIQIRKIKVFLGNHYSKWKFAIFVFKRRYRFQFSSEIYLVGTQKKGNDETNRKILFSTWSVMKIRKFSAQNRENLMKKYLCQKKTRFKIWLVSSKYSLLYVNLKLKMCGIEWYQSYC